MSIDITIDPEFQALIQPLAAIELELLTEQIRQHGCLEPLAVWKTPEGQRILLDGHNRYAICTKLSRGYNTVNVSLASREHAKLWILEHQAGRRNLTDDQRAVVWNEIREQRSKVARAEQLQAAREAKENPVSAKSADTDKPKADTRREVAQESRLPESKLRKVAALKKSNPALYEGVRMGQIKLRDAKPATVKPKNLRDRYSEKEFFNRIGSKLEGTLLRHPVLDELLAMKKSDWTSEAAEAFPKLIASLSGVNARVDDYIAGLRKVLRQYGKKAA